MMNATAEKKRNRDEREEQEQQREWKQGQEEEEEEEEEQQRAKKRQRPSIEGVIAVMTKGLAEERKADVFAFAAGPGMCITEEAYNKLVGHTASALEAELDAWGI